MQVINETELRDDLLWGAGAIARYIGRSKRQTYYLLEKGQVPARKIGDLWLGSKTTLDIHLTGEQS
ncbi:hypothetical protein [Rhizobium ruizarguesonis]|uniref:hypothetical protein n=1 Tax=Rhizobium ruizarguesonis TaxID=2081791 RepID=UPI001031D90A|nr:hypothetical protein [Rhizobium ruizarguesonis]TAT82460.1 hypothetical protein ELI52_02585 [Rhizobium ruizarguesonis]